MKRDKSAGKQLGHRLTLAQPREHIAFAVLENEDAAQRSALRQSEAAFPVPRRSVHINLTRIIARLKVACRAGAHNDAVIAENSHVVERSPQARGRALARAGMPDEQIIRAIGS